jgi:hypothetical protein
MMTEVKRPLDSKMEGKVPPVEAKDAPQADDTKTGTAPDETEEKDK